MRRAPAGSALATALLAVAASATPLARAADDVPLAAMRDELARSVRELRLDRMDRPYFLAYRMDEVEGIAVSATLGSLTSFRPGHARVIGVEVRVGDYAFDNSNYVSMHSFGSGGGLGALTQTGQAPLDDDYQQIRRQFWLATDAQYKKALEDLAAKRAAFRATQRAEDLPDFTREAATSAIEPRRRTLASRDELSALAREVSAAFRPFPEIDASSVTLSFEDVYTRFVNSEGTSFTRSTPSVKLVIRAEAQGAASRLVSQEIELHGRAPADLPPRDALVARARELAARVLALRSSPGVERYAGPVLFEGTAAAELFAQEFAPGLVAVRPPATDDPRFDSFFREVLSRLGGAALQDKIGARVLPDFLSVTDDPSRQSFGGAALLGGNRLDDDGVPSRETRLVERGVLKGLLATRIPTRAAARSTGSRRTWGPAPSNLFVTSGRTVPDAALRKELLRRVRERGLEYGIVVRRVGGGSLGRLASRMGAGAGAADASLAEVYRLRPDGREELLQGMQLAEVSAATFKDIVAAGDAPAVFTDEFSGGLGAIFSLGSFARANPPVTSYVVPSLLFEDASLVASRASSPSRAVAPSPLARP